ncbi:DUF2190 family protein [Pseudorhodobacter sp.]|uniref:DUF2190 family protein n=1 Tax=Pseudorhodobacter sp. TaxID=1934400 RepID=UPI0039E514E8
MIAEVESGIGSAALGDPVELAATGAFQLSKASTAVLTVGARLAWDNTAKTLNLPGTGRFSAAIWMPEATHFRTNAVLPLSRARIAVSDGTGQASINSQVLAGHVATLGRSQPADQ